MGWRQWIEPRSSDERTARQEQLVNILALAAALCATIYLLAMLVLLVVQPEEVSWASPLGGVIAIVLSTAVYALARSGRVQAAAILIVAAAAFIGLYSTYVRGTITVAAVMLALPVIFAGLAIGGRAGAITAAVVFSLYLALTFLQLQPWGLQPILQRPAAATVAGAAAELPDLGGIVLVFASLILIALVTWQTVQSLEEFRQRAEERQRVLQVLADEKDTLVEELRAREEAQHRLVEMVRELGSPVIPLARRVIAMPLIGTLDSERIQQIMTTLLEGVEARRARVAIVDITAVPVVDTAVAGALLKAARGIRLLGAEPVLTGIQPEVAQTIVGLGVDLSGVTTRATLEEGLAYALQLESRQ